jgi:hypothetical protein
MLVIPYLLPVHPDIGNASNMAIQLWIEFLVGHQSVGLQDIRFIEDAVICQIRYS